MTVMPHRFINRDDRSQRVLAELERVVVRLEVAVGEARSALAELRAERVKGGGDGSAGESCQGDR